MTSDARNPNYLSAEQFNKLLREEVSPASRNSSADAFKALRGPQAPETLQRKAFTWLAKLPENLRPLELGRVYPRIANRLTAIWGDSVLTARYLNDLLVDKRGGRQGFPLAVAQELRKLRYYIQSQISDSSDARWSEERGRSRYKEDIA